MIIQLLRPRFLPLLTPTQRTTIVQVVGQLIRILGSDDVVLDRYHSPAVYSKFLANLLDRYHVQPDISEAVEPSNVASDAAARERSPPLSHAWPDTPGTLNSRTAVTDTVQANDPKITLDGYTEHIGHQEMVDFDMDFSLTHFVQSAHTSPGAWGSASELPPSVSIDALEGLFRQDDSSLARDYSTLRPSTSDDNRG